MCCLVANREPKLANQLSPQRRTKLPLSGVMSRSQDFFALLSRLLTLTLFSIFLVFLFGLLKALGFSPVKICPGKKTHLMILSLPTHHGFVHRHHGVDLQNCLLKQDVGLLYTSNTGIGAVLQFMCGDDDDSDSLI